jgi:hypothetical protein
MYFDFIGKNSTSPINFVVKNSTSPIDFVVKNSTSPINFIVKNSTSPIRPELFTQHSPCLIKAPKTNGDYFYTEYNICTTHMYKERSRVSHSQIFDWSKYVTISNLKFTSWIFDLAGKPIINHYLVQWKIVEGGNATNAWQVATKYLVSH